LLALWRRLGRLPGVHSSRSKCCGLALLGFSHGILRRKLMPRSFHPKRDLAAQNAFKKRLS
jgi:hypothetical protein